jgi:hypothetical protein
MPVRAHGAGAIPSLDLEGPGAAVAGVEPACVLNGERCRLSGTAARVTESWFEDQAWAGQEIVVSGPLASQHVDARWVVRLPHDDPAALVRLELTNMGDRPLGLDVLTPVFCPGQGAGWVSPEGTLRCLEIRAHSWADKSVSILDDGFESEMVGAVATEDGRGMVAGLVSFGESAGRVRGQLEERALRLETRNDFERMALAPGGTVASGWAFVDLSGDVFEGLERWAGAAASQSGRRRV